MLLASVLTFFSCAEAKTPDADSGTAIDGSQTESAGSYLRISQEEAARIMSEDPGVVILDVRTKEEFGEGHIKGAICVPNEAIGDTAPEELPDKTQTILVYCRSGRRSKLAAQKLADLGYTDIREFGGIITWTGDIVS